MLTGVSLLVSELSFVQVDQLEERDVNTKVKYYRIQSEFSKGGGLKNLVLIQVLAGCCILPSAYQ